jgi:hypothetical protein
MTESISPPPYVLGIHLTPEMSLSAGWKDFAGNISSAIADLIMQRHAEATVGGVSSFVKLALSLKLEPNVGQRAWALSVLSFAWSIDEIKLAISGEESILRDALKVAIDSAKESVKYEGIVLPNSFLSRPTSIPVYKHLKDTFIDSYLKEDSPDNIKLISLKIDAAYNRAIYELWSRRPEFYNPIAEALSSPASTAAELGVNWLNYRHKLIYDFEVKPLFGQEDTGIALSQLYVPLRACWPKEGSQDEVIDDDSSDNFQSNIGMLDDLLGKWLADDDQSDRIRLIGGGPGSGKSTTIKCLARRLADSELWRPLLIPLQHIDIHTDLRDSINSYFTDTTDSAFVQKPLSRPSVEDGPPLLLLFDGLDELAAPGEAAKDVIGTFANRLNSLISALDGGGARKIKVVVSGRMPAFQAARKYLTPVPNGSLEALGFVSHLDVTNAQNSLWSLDQRAQWWTQYAVATKQSTAVPEAFSNSRLAGITHEPLLCYLLALAGYATEQWELAADNRNRIYAALVNSIYDRGWGDGLRKRQGAGKNLSKNDFNKLMETIALAAWLGGDARVASEEKFEQCIEIMAAQEAWHSFTDDDGEDVTNLAMNFYLKSSEKAQRGFEFTHKSFGEYLAARALLSIAEEVAGDAARRPTYALQDWFRATKSGLFNSEILAFMFDEQRLTIGGGPKGLSRVKKIKSAFAGLAATVFHEGFSAKSDSSTWRAQEAEQLNAECGIWVVLSACGRSLFASGHETDALTEIEWQGENEISTLLNRLGDRGATVIINQCLNNLKLTAQQISWVGHHSMNFDASDLSDAVIISSTLGGGSFLDANMTDARFYECRISNINFDRADMTNVIFQSCKINNCSFHDAVLTDLVASPATVLVSDLDHIESIRSALKVMTYRDAGLEDIVSYMEKMVAHIAKMETHMIKDLIKDFNDNE